MRRDASDSTSCLECVAHYPTAANPHVRGDVAAGGSMTARRVRYDPDSNRDVTMRDIVYRQHGDHALLTRIYEPVGEGPFPLLVDVHGGGWTIGDRTSDEPIDRAIAASGMMVAAIDYRLAPGHPYPAQLADLNFALR